MKVSELIEVLKGLPQEKHVVCQVTALEPNAQGCTAQLGVNHHNLRTLPVEADFKSKQP